MYKYNNMLAISVGIKAKCPLRKIMQSKKVSCRGAYLSGSMAYLKMLFKSSAIMDRNNNKISVYYNIEQSLGDYCY